ncbi:MAG TPA: hypothetical protein VK932_25450 [Kofleriaceae bacterium]|nr:hypothetical protein [Kofleriaceae bacterium]
MRERRAAALAVLVGLVIPQAAAAQPAAGAQAEVLFRQGKELLAAGKIAEACAAFDASQKLDPAVTTALNQANCREKNRQLASAWGLYLEVARRTRGAATAASQRMHEVASERAAQLEPRLSTLRIAVPAERRADGLEVLRDGEVLDPAAWGQALPTDGGTYRITARAPGRREWSGEVTVAVERDAKTIEIPELPPAEPDETKPEPAPARVDEEPETSAAGEPGTRWSGKRKLAVGIAGGGVVALAVGGVLGVSSRSKQRDAEELCPDVQLPCDDADRANALVQSARGRAIGANVAFGVGAAAAIAAGVLWFTGAPESRRSIAVAPSVSPGRVFLTASRSF